MLEGKLNRCKFCQHIHDGSDSERIRHLHLEHSNICIYCGKVIHHIMIEHVILQHENKCPFCEFSDDYSSESDRLKHLQLFHRDKKNIFLEPRRYA